MRNLVSRERPSRGRFRRRRRAAANRSVVSFPTDVGRGPMVERGRADTYTARAMARGPINASRRPLRTAFFRQGESPLAFSRRRFISFFLSGLARRFESKRADPAGGRGVIYRGEPNPRRGDRAARTRRGSNVKGPLRSRFLKN